MGPKRDIHSTAGPSRSSTSQTGFAASNGDGSSSSNGAASSVPASLPKVTCNVRIGRPPPPPVKNSRRVAANKPKGPRGRPSAASRNNLASGLSSSAGAGPSNATRGRGIQPRIRPQDRLRPTGAIIGHQAAEVSTNASHLPTPNFASLNPPAGLQNASCLPDGHFLPAMARTWKHGQPGGSYGHLSHPPGPSTPMSSMRDQIDHGQGVITPSGPLNRSAYSKNRLHHDPPTSGQILNLPLSIPGTRPLGALGSVARESKALPERHFVHPGDLADVIVDLAEIEDIGIVEFLNTDDEDEEEEEETEDPEGDNDHDEEADMDLDERKPKRGRPRLHSSSESQRPKHSQRVEPDDEKKPGTFRLVTSIAPTITCDEDEQYSPPTRYKITRMVQNGPIVNPPEIEERKRRAMLYGIMTARDRKTPEERVVELMKATAMQAGWTQNMTASNGPGPSSAVVNSQGMPRGTEELLRPFGSSFFTNALPDLPVGMELGSTGGIGSGSGDVHLSQLLGSSTQAATRFEATDMGLRAGVQQWRATPSLSTTSQTSLPPSAVSGQPRGQQGLKIPNVDGDVGSSTAAFDHDTFLSSLLGFGEAPPQPNQANGSD